MRSSTRPLKARLTTTTMLFSAMGGLLLAPLPATTPAATASSYYLCKEYSGCGQAGYSDGGYGRVNSTMFWRMFPGHNCTNYVAHRMIQAGMSSERPWTGSGNASNWGHAMSRITDTTPAVGAVAWWDRNVPGAGSAGHVAVVEKVISPTEIMVSEDSWGGTFSWRRIVKDTVRGWPTGFIHFVDKKVVANQSTPQVTGDPRVGAPLQAKRGAWTSGSTFSYQWLVDGARIDGATRASYTPTAAQVGRTIAVRVDGAKPGFSGASATSRATDAVAPGDLATNGAPVVTGTPTVGEVLTATTPGWTPAAERSSFTWYADGVAIRRGARLTLTRDLVGKRVGVVHVAQAAGYERAESAASNIVGPVIHGAVQVVEPFGASGLNRVGEELAVLKGVLEPSDATLAYEWTREGVVVPGADQSTYRLTPQDLGARIVARVTISKPGFRDAVRTFHFGEAVTTRPTVRVATAGRVKGASVGIRVAAPGVGPAEGSVTVVIGRQTMTVTLVGGRARAIFPSLAPGARRVVVTYAGNGLVERVVTRAEVQVKP